MIRLKKELSFDLFGRYETIRAIIDNNRNDGQRFRVLDVGGRGNLLKRFLASDDVFFLDPLLDSDAENFIKADGCQTGLRDEEFDWVTSADVFEHIPQHKREIFVEENLRIAKQGVILVAPFDCPDVTQAELNANDIHKSLHGGADDIWLKEHIENKLPNPIEFEALLRRKGYRFQKLQNNGLFFWQSLLSYYFIVTGNNDLEAVKKKEEFNYFYNTEIYPHDNQGPSYRKIYFIKKASDLRDLAVSDSPVDNSLLLKVMHEGLGSVSAVCARNRDRISELERCNRELKSKISFMESSKFWRLRNKYNKMKRMFRKFGAVPK